MKILIITAGFFPGQKYGGPPVSVDNFCSLMSDSNNGGQHECYIVTTNHDLGETKVYESIKDGWNDRGNCKVLYLSRKNFGYKKFKQVLQDLGPDLLYLQSIFSSYILPTLFLAKKMNIKTLLAPRGELCSGAFNKKYKKVPYIFVLRICGLLKNVYMQSTSDEETMKISSLLNAQKSRIYQITNIPSIPKITIEVPPKQNGEVHLVFVSRIVDKKNLKFAIEILKEIKGRIVYNIYGPLENRKYWAECEQLIQHLPSNVTVNYCGLISHDEVHSVFNHHHGFLFPTFSENYGQVIAESLLVGCPVIISDQTPWTDVNDNNAGWAIPLSERNKYVEAVQSLVDMNQEDFNLIHDSSIKYVAHKIELNKIKFAYEKIMND